MVLTIRRTSLAIAMAYGIVMLNGCSSVFKDAIPARCIGPDPFHLSRADREPINFLRLRQDPPAAYQLGPRDVLGIYIEGVLGNREEPPPVHFPEDGNLPPAIGYPVPIREDGTISLPLIPPIPLGGLTLAQAEQRIRQEYTLPRRDILKPSQDRTIVTLMRPRTYHVLVVREDTSSPTGQNTHRLEQALAFGLARRGMTHAVELRAYENDVLHALSETGGLPGFDAKNEVTILRGAFSNPQEQQHYMEMLQNPAMHGELLAHPNVIRIPLRLGPLDPPLELKPEDVILSTGDIIFVQTRETEVYYTGGLLPPGQHPLPRDYDVDIIEAMAMAGGSVSGGAASNQDAFRQNGGATVGAIFPPTRAIILRNINGEHIPIAVDLKRAMLDSSERVRIIPGDFITLEYTPLALAGNLGLSIFRFNYLLNNR